MDIRQKSLEKHYEWNGKIEVISRVPISNAEDLSLAYTPALPSLALKSRKITTSLLSLQEETILLQ